MVYESRAVWAQDIMALGELELNPEGSELSVRPRWLRLDSEVVGSWDHGNGSA